MDADQWDESDILSIDPIAPAYRQIANQLRLAVVSGRLRPGMRLPKEADLANSFRVSRSTIREALRELASQHLIKTTRGAKGGTFIVRPEPHEISTMMTRSLGLLSQGESLPLEDILEAHELLEVEMACLAAERWDSEGLAELEECVRSEVDAIGSGDHSTHRTFHEVLLEQANNQLLDIVIAPISEVLRVRFRREGLSADFWHDVVGDHRSILEAVKSRDRSRTADEMRRHIRKIAPIYREIDRFGGAEPSIGHDGVGEADVE